MPTTRVSDVTCAGSGNREGIEGRNSVASNQQAGSTVSFATCFNRKGIYDEVRIFSSTQVGIQCILKVKVNYKLIDKPNWFTFCYLIETSLILYENAFY